MHHRDIAALMAGIVPSLRKKVAEVVDPLAARLKALEEREPVRGEKGEPGLNGKDGAAGLDGKDGADGVPGAPGADGAPGRDGVDGKDGAAGLDGKDGAPGADGMPGRDGLDGKDGAHGVDGKDGPAGRDGRDGLPGLQGEKGLDGKDGRDGLDGRDGFGLDDFDVRSDDDGRTLVFCFSREGAAPIERVVRTAIVLDRGVWREQGYGKGDGVSWGGQFYIARRDTEAAEKPLDGSEAWRLSIKRGRDGRDGKDGKDGINGKDGAPGRDGRNGF